MRRLTHIVVLVAFIFSCGGHWGVLQCVAWVNMIHEYSQVVPMTQAIEMTFSGQYPCEMCKIIAEKKNSEQQKTLALEKYDKKFLPVVTSRTFEPACSTISYPVLAQALLFRHDSPSVPPPRAELI